MAEETQPIFYQSVREILQAWGLPIDPWAAEIATQISQGTAQWQQTMNDGRFLHLLRVYAPIIQREEVFLGSVLLNDFFFKAIPTAAERIGLAQFTAVANDLESTYFLAHGYLDVTKLQEAFFEIVGDFLPVLYFGSNEPQKGIHGDFRNLFYFEKSDFEPFPIYAIPEFLARELEGAIRKLLKKLLLEDEYEKNFRTVRSAISFFYGRTSGGSGDAQSFDMFLYRLVTEYEVVQKEDVERLFAIDNVEKSAIKTAFDNRQFDPNQYRSFLLRLVTYFGESIDNGTDDWLMGFIFKDAKLMPMTKRQFTAEIFHGVQLGIFTNPVSAGHDISAVCCPICGQRMPYVRESYIIAGRAKGRFRTRDNKRGTKRQESIVCAKCALCVYVSQRLLGNFEGVWQQQPRKTARMPTKHNIIFHYGQHKDDEREVFERQLDYLIEHARTDKSITALHEGVTTIRREILLTLDEIADNDLYEDWNEPIIEVVAQLESNAQSKVLALGLGSHRLFVFVLPQFNPSPKESEDFIQERFSGSRLAAFTLLALLRQLCGCDGSYYYRSLPKLSTATEDDIFYISNQKELASGALRKYGAIANFAKRVNSYKKGRSQLTGWILLAEALLEDPLGIFSDVLRASPIRLGDDFNDLNIKYKRLSSDWDGARGLGVIDSTEYLALYEQLHELAKEMN